MVEYIGKVLGINKLLDYAASGFGAVAGPMIANWKAEKEGTARLTAVRADSDVRRIEAESEAETSLIIAKARSKAREYLVTPDAEVHGTVEIARDSITQRIEYQEQKRLANIKAVVEGAADELGDKEVSDHEPDPDWTARFFDCVQDVSSEGVQKIWAKILAGEVRIEGPPGTEINPMDLTVTVLTPSGEELARFCEDKPNVEYLSCFARYLEKYHCKLKLAPVSSRTPDGRMMFDPKTMRIL